MAGIEAFLVLPVATFHLAVVTWGVGTDEFMTDTQTGSSSLKEGGQIPLAVGKTVGELKAIVGLDAFHPNAPTGIPFEQLSEEISRRVGVLLGVGGQEAQPCKLVNGSVLKQAEF